MMEYKGYTGVVEFDPEGAIFAGHVIDLRDQIYFEGRSVEELEASMRRAVDQYLAICEARGEEPDRPFSGNLHLRLGPELHRAAATAAAAEGRSLNSRRGAMRCVRPASSAFATLILMSGCGSELVAPERDESAPIQTDDVAYRVELTENLGTIHLTITYRNETSGTRFLSRCGEIGPAVILQRSTGGGWVDAWVPDCPRVAAEPVVVGPDEAFTTSLTLYGSRRPDAEPRHRVPAPGTYRLSALIHAEWDFDVESASGPMGPPVPEEERVSNAFLVTR